MKTKKNVLSVISLILIIPFFLMIVFFILTASHIGDEITTIDQTFTIHVEGGQANPDSHAFKVSLPSDGSYYYSLTLDVEEPGFTTAFTSTDSTGKLNSAFTAYQTEDLPCQVQAAAGETTLELFFLDDENAMREFAKNYYHYEDGQKLESFIGQYDFSTPPADGDRTMHVVIKISPLVPAPFALQLATLAVGALILICLFLSLSKEHKDDATLKERFDEIGNSHSIFLVAVILTQMIVNVILINFLAEFASENTITLSLLLTILSVDVIGFPLAYLACKGVPTQPIPEKKIGAGKFLLFVLMSFGIVLPGALLGSIVHNLITLPFGGAETAISQIMANSGMFPRVLAVGIGAPIFEELVFRKLIVDRLIKYGEFIAVFTSGLTFGLFHGNFQQFFFAFALGLLFAFVYVRTGRIRYTIGLHMTINMTTSVITAFLYSKYAEYAPNTTDLADIQEFLTSSGEAGLYVALYAIWNVLLYLIAIVGVILLITFIAKKRFRLRRSEGEATRGEALKAMFSSKLMLVFLLGTLGLFLLSYLPVFLRA